MTHFVVYYWLVPFYKLTVVANQSIKTHTYMCFVVPSLARQLSIVGVVKNFLRCSTSCLPKACLYNCCRWQEPLLSHNLAQSSVYIRLGTWWQKHTQMFMNSMLPGPISVNVISASNKNINDCSSLHNTHNRWLQLRMFPWDTYNTLTSGQNSPYIIHL